MVQRIGTLVRKEFIQIVRDPVALGLMIALPVLLLFIFGYAINLDVKNISMAVFDQDNSKTSRSVTESFVSSGYFFPRQIIQSEAEITELLDKGAITVVLRFPANFQRDLLSGKNTPVQVVIDGTDSNTANIVMSYTKAILQAESMDVMFSLLNTAGLMEMDALPVLDIRPNIWYNPELSSSNFLVPGIIGIIIMVIGAIRMSVSLVKEKEQGTIESLMVSPLKAHELMIGKMVPYIVIVFIDLLLIVFCAQWFFNVPFRGSFFFFLVVSFVYLGAALGVGLYISAISKTTQTAWILGFLITIMPSIMLSGFIFPIESMPKFVQFITYLFPVRYFLTILRGIILKGVGFSILYPETIILIGFTLVAIALCSLTFKKRY